MKELERSSNGVGKGGMGRVPHSEFQVQSCCQGGREDSTRRNVDASESAAASREGKDKPRSMVAALLGRRAGGQAQMPVQRVGAANDVEDDGVELRQIIAVENVGDILERYGLPNVHANEDVAAADALLGSRAARTNFEDGQAAAIPSVEALELVGIHHGQLQADCAPRSVRQPARFLRGARKLSDSQLGYDLLRVAEHLDFDIFSRLRAEERELHVEPGFDAARTDCRHDVARFKARLAGRTLGADAGDDELPLARLAAGLARDTVRHLFQSLGAHQAGGDFQGFVYRYGEADALSTHANCDVDANNLAVDV